MFSMHPLALAGHFKARVLASHPDGVMGELFHLGRFDGGGHCASPIGHFVGFPQPGHPEQRAHWRVEAYFRTDFRDDRPAGVVTVDAAPPVSPRADYPGVLPERLADQLLATTACTAPLLLYVHVGHNTSYVQRGSLWED
jgi:hypothetical protein